MNNPLGMLLNMGNVLQMASQLRQNPMAMLQKAGFNVPANLNDPQQMIQHLMNSGQVTQQQFDQALQQAQKFGMK